MTVLDIIPIAFVLIATFAAINYHYLKMPGTIGMLVIALVASTLVTVVDNMVPALAVGLMVRETIQGIDFHDTLMKGFLSFLLFAGALHVDLDELMKRKAPIALMASFGVVLSTFVVGYGFHLATETTLMIALVFGALISPTDPVAVMGILKTVKVPKSLETKIAGESLFNDGIGVVVFSVIVAIAFPGGDKHLDVTLPGVAMFLAQEAIGGAVLGGIAGYLTFLVLRRIDDYVVEIIITLALVTGVYALATHLHAAGPIAVVVAGLFIGNKGMSYAMSEKTRQHQQDFWHLLDEILNALLFTLIGFEVLTLDMNPTYIVAGLIAIPLMVFGRFLAVSIPVKLLSLKQDFTKGAIPVLTWGGLRGGISVALALSLPHGPERDMILTATCVVVFFSVVIQGLTVGAVIKRFVKA